MMDKANLDRGNSHLDPSTIAGMVVRRTLVQGHPIPLDSVRPADTIIAGRTVTLQYVAPGVIISAPALALQSGSPGEAIKAQVNETLSVVKGTVQADGRLTISD